MGDIQQTSTGVPRPDLSMRSPRDLGINLRRLGLSPRQIEGMTPAEFAEQLRKAGRYLLWYANEIDKREKSKPRKGGAP